MTAIQTTDALTRIDFGPIKKGPSENQSVSSKKFEKTFSDARDTQTVKKSSDKKSETQVADKPQDPDPEASGQDEQPHTTQTQLKSRITAASGPAQDAQNADILLSQTASETEALEQVIVTALDLDPAMMAEAGQAIPILPQVAMKLDIIAADTDSASPFSMLAAPTTPYTSVSSQAIAQSLGTSTQQAEYIGQIKTNFNGDDLAVAQTIIGQQLAQPIEIEQNLLQTDVTQKFVHVPAFELNGPANMATPITPQPTQFNIQQNAVINTALPTWTAGFVEQITQRVQDGVQEFEINLAPEKLGHVSIKIDMRGDAANVTIVTQTADAQRLFNDTQDRLTAMLAQSGLEMGHHQTQNQQDRQSEKNETADGGNGRGELTTDGSEQVVTQNTSSQDTLVDFVA